eukprot:49834-Hanusia_phi.AAC.1
MQDTMDAKGEGEGAGQYNEDDCEDFLAQQDRIAMEKRLANQMSAGKGEEETRTEAKHVGPQTDELFRETNRKKCFKIPAGKR